MHCVLEGLTKTRVISIYTFSCMQLSMQVSSNHCFHTGSAQSITIMTSTLEDTARKLVRCLWQFLYLMILGESQGHLNYFKGIYAYTHLWNWCVFLTIDPVSVQLPIIIISLLVTAITILLGQPTHSDVELADMLMNYFVKQMEPFYGCLQFHFHSSAHKELLSASVLL